MSKQSTPKSTATKKAQLIHALSRKSGVGLEPLCKDLGWQPHTLQAALSRLRKEGYVLDQQMGKSGAAFRIVTEPTPTSATP